MVSQGGGKAIRESKTPVRNGLSAYLCSHEHPGGIIVCEKKKFIYMKPARTAGTSILRNHLEKHLPRIIHLKDHPEEFHAWLEGISDQELDDYFIFSVTRNPWDRIVSVASRFKVPLPDLVHNIDHYWKDQPKIRSHSLPIYLYTHSNGKRFVDMVCRFESLQTDFNVVANRIGIDQGRLPHANRSIHKHYSKYYGKEERDIVAELYSKDIEYFGYTF